MKNNYFGHNLKFLRKSFNLSQQQMARIVGKTFTAVSRTGGYIMFCYLLPSVIKWLFKPVFVIC